MLRSDESEEFLKPSISDLESENRAVSEPDMRAESMKRTISTAI